MWMRGVLRCHRWTLFLFLCLHRLFRLWFVVFVVMIVLWFRLSGSGRIILMGSWLRRTAISERDK